MSTGKAWNQSAESEIISVKIKDNVWPSEIKLALKDYNSNSMGKKLKYKNFCVIIQCSHACKGADEILASFFV